MRFFSIVLAAALALALPAHAQSAPDSTASMTPTAATSMQANPSAASGLPQQPATNPGTAAQARSIYSFDVPQGLYSFLGVDPGASGATSASVTSQGLRPNGSTLGTNASGLRGSSGQGSTGLSGTSTGQTATSLTGSLFP